MQSSRRRTSSRLAAAAFVVALFAPVARCCMSQGGSTTVEIGKATSVCLVMNGRKVLLMTPKADDFSRFTLKDSFSDMEKCSDDYFTSDASCPFNKTEPVQGCRGTDIPDGGFSTNFYVESLGVKTQYKKVMVNPCDELFFPLLTVIVTVKDGAVVGVNWDDGCYMCDPNVGTGDNPCVLNAFNKTSNERLDEATLTKGRITGKDCAITATECAKKKADGTNVCEQNVYVVWTAAM